MCAAIYAARSGAQVTIIEKNDCLGKKLSMTGNGRCNLTNLNISGEDYNPAARGRISKWLETYGPDEVICFFKSLGIVTLSEEGYIYPVSGQAKSVVRALEKEIERLRIEVLFKQQLKSVERTEGRDTVEVVTNSGRYEAEAVIIATGSCSGPKSTMSTGDGYYICRKLGMNIKDTYPALVGFKAASGEILPSQGVRCPAAVSFMLGGEVLAREEGELQLTGDGISGIPVMQASRAVTKLLSEKKPICAVIDFFPEYGDQQFDILKKDMLKLRDDRTLEDFLVGFANSNITDMILSGMKLSKSMKMKNISVDMTECILDAYRAHKIFLGESYGYQASQVTTGGVSLGDIGDDFSCVNDHRIFVTGELLDVDGRCGGYNLTFAFAAGSIAGSAAAKGSL